MIEVIFAMDSNGGVGYRGSIPWSIKMETFIFKMKTMGHCVIVGKTTYMNLPELVNRTVVVVSKNSEEVHDLCFDNIEKAIEFCLTTGKTIFIIGGVQIYQQVFKNFDHLITKIHFSILKEEYTCDTFLTFPKSIIEKSTSQDFGEFIHYEYKANVDGEIQYLELIKQVLTNGFESGSRNGITRRMFGKHLKFDLREGFPLLTTKKMFFRGIVEELLFFMRGDTDSKILEKKGVNIWKGNTSREFLDKMGFDYPEGEMGPMYGAQWRNFNGQHIDQLSNVIEKLKKEPDSRRIMMTTFNPAQSELGVLYPCHSIITQFFVQDGFLDMFCYNRSSDLFLGLPFNIASSALLQIIIAKLVGLKPRYFNLSLGDAHIYEQHFEAVKTQISRVPHKFPKIEINSAENFADMKYEDFTVVDYTSHPTIKAPMVA
jgi:thymidylate synthase